MTINLGKMVPGAEVEFSLDLAKMIPAGETLSSAVVKALGGTSAATAEYLTTIDTKVYFLVSALAEGKAEFDVIGTFSNGRADGDRVLINVE